MRNFNNFIENVPVINPSSNYLIIWDFIHSVIILFCVFYLPIEWITGATFIHIYKNEWMQFLIVSMIIFGIDILVNFNVGYFKRGMCIMNRREICLRYLKTSFICDLLSIVPLIVSLNFLEGAD